jgi:hypothetical protein
VRSRRGSTRYSFGGRRGLVLGCLRWWWRGEASGSRRRLWLLGSGEVRGGRDQGRRLRVRRFRRCVALRGMA